MMYRRWIERAAAALLQNHGAAFSAEDEQYFDDGSTHQQQYVYESRGRGRFAYDDDDDADDWRRHSRAHQD